MGASPVADAFVVKAKDAGWEVNDLKGNTATKTNIVNTINNWNPDFVVYYGHSLNSYIPGQQNNQLQFAITPSNISLLSNRTASITACHTVSTIGFPAIKAGAVCSLGYKVPFTGVWESLLDHDFKEARAKDKGSKRWKKFYDDLVIYMKNNPNYIRVKKMDPTIPGGLLNNANGLDYVGNPNAVARPIGILLTTS